MATVYELTKRATLLSKEVSGAAINTHGIPLQMLRTRRKAYRAVMCYAYVMPMLCHVLAYQHAWHSTTTTIALDLEEGTLGQSCVMAPPSFT